jgi:ornithine cyclodeaminase
MAKAVCLDLSLVDAIEGGFAALARGEIVMPPIMSIDVHEYDGQVDAKSAYILSFPRFAIKIASGFPNNRLRGLPSGWGRLLQGSLNRRQPQSLSFRASLRVDPYRMCPAIRPLKS